MAFISNNDFLIRSGVCVYEAMIDMSEGMMMNREKKAQYSFVRKGEGLFSLSPSPSVFERDN